MRADAQRKRQEIIDAATMKYRTSTDSEITLVGIAHDADVGIATLYRHFPTRDDLRVACVLNLFDTLEAVLNEALKTFDDAPETTWASLIWQLVDYGIGMLVVALATGRTGDINPAIARKYDEFFDAVKVLVDKAAHHGLVAPEQDAVELAAELIVVTRPQGGRINELFPDVKNRLVHHLLQAWKQPGRSSRSTS